RTSEPVRAASIFLCPADCGIDGNSRDMDALRHQLPRHALRESGLRMARHCKGCTQWETLECGACVRKDDGPLCAVGIRSVLAHQLCRVLADQKGAERRVAQRLQSERWLGLGDRLAKDAGNSAI